MKRYIHASADNSRRLSFVDMFKKADTFDGVSIEDIEDAADWKLPDGSHIYVESLGRDFGFDVFGVDRNGNLKAYVCVDNWAEENGAAFDEIDTAVRNGARTLEDVFNMWENGLGGNPFDEDYFPDL